MRDKRFCSGVVKEDEHSSYMGLYCIIYRWGHKVLWVK